MLQKTAGFKVTLVPSGGAAGSATALLGGHVDFAVCQLQAAGPHIKSGDLRALAQVATKRHPDIPNVPTLSELGYQVPFEGYAGLVAPKGLGKEVLTTIASAIDQTIKTHGKDVGVQIGKMSAELDYLNAQEFGKVLRQQRDAAKAVLADLKKAGQK
jgi:tripartite-type tricarboxylate transporter receptor subunit TctC